MSAFSKRHVILRYVCIYVSVCKGICIYRARGNSQATPVLAAPVFSQGESRIPFIQKAGNGYNDSIILGLAGLIILSYCVIDEKGITRGARSLSLHTLWLQGIQLCEKLSNKQSGSVIFRVARLTYTYITLQYNLQKEDTSSVEVISHSRIQLNSARVKFGLTSLKELPTDLICIKKCLFLIKLKGTIVHGDVNSSSWGICTIRIPSYINVTCMEASHNVSMHGVWQLC